MTDANRIFVVVASKHGAAVFAGTVQQIEADLWQYFDSIEERSQGVILADAPLKEISDDNRKG